MKRLRFLTAGESHGQALSAVVEGVPAGLELSEEDLLAELRRRQRGHGRGGRMKIEQDRARILSGVRYGLTLGSPIALLLENRDWPNWTEKMSVTPVDRPAEKLQMPRPGHADYSGMIKYRHDDLRNVLERSSARETAMRVAVGAIARKLLKRFSVSIYGQIVRIGSAASPATASFVQMARDADWDALQARIEDSPVACPDQDAAAEMMAQIDAAAVAGDTLGGRFEIAAVGAPVGLGSHVHWDRKLDGLIAGAMVSIPAIKAVEIGLGIDVSGRPGSRVHDEIFFDTERGYYRGGNHAGGIEGGISNGQPIVVRLAMKPLPTLAKPLRSVDTATGEPREAFRERADVCAAPAAVVIAEAMLALVLADALCEKLGGDSIDEMERHFRDLPRAPMEW